MKFQLIQGASLTPVKLGRRVALYSPQYEASQKGLSRYQGNACKYGHNGIRYTNNGQCVECRKFKPTGGKVGGKPNPNRLIALQNGDEFYHSNKPCKQGHIGKRFTKTSLCVECKDYRRLRRNPKNHQYNLAKFGLSVEDYKALLKKQNGVCAICSRPESRVDPKTNKIKQLAVDHCHDTKVVRGLLCAQCNMGIGNLCHNVEWLRKAALYCEVV